MQFLQNAVGSLLEEYPDGRTLQRSGKLSKEQVLEFFDRSLKLFEDADFKQQLKESHQLGLNVEEHVTDEQKKIFESMGIEGEYGVQFLGQIRTVYGSDKDVMVRFWPFVQQEELAYCEAEGSQPAVFVPPCQNHQQQNCEHGRAHHHEGCDHSYHEHVPTAPPPPQDLDVSARVPPQATSSALTEEEQLAFFKNTLRG